MSRLSPPTLMSGLLSKVSEIHQKSWSGGNSSVLRAVIKLWPVLVLVTKRQSSDSLYNGKKMLMHKR